MNYTKQTQEQYAANIAAVEKSLLPAILAPTVANGQMVSGYMLKTYFQNGVVDASVENLRAAVLALKDQLEWQVPPAKRAARLDEAEGWRDQDPIKGYDTPEPKESKPMVGYLEGAKQAITDEYNLQAERQAANFIASFGAGMRHSQRFEAKEKLQIKWNELLQRGAKPKEAFETLKAWSKTLWSGPAWAPNKEKSR